MTAASQVLVNRLWVEGMDRSGVDPKPPSEPERGPAPLRRALGVALGVVKRR
ncbi:MAG TPA: hypothetical protein VGV91_05565 [Rubrobacter sp.]|nr:hypothetical protein [Rubrobacter sp.]